MIIFGRRALLKHKAGLPLAESDDTHPSFACRTGENWVNASNLFIISETAERGSGRGRAS